jgi:UDP-2-acetamido-3-amino-2,3-dideoxy-glucuronate N-acetyltransferase
VSTFIDPSARFEAEDVGAGSRVLAYARVGRGVTIGRNCVIHDHAVLVGDVTLDDDVAVHVGAQLLGSVHLEQGVAVGAGALVGAGSLEGEPSRSIVHRFASIGVNATVLPGVVIGRHAVVEPGSVITQNVPANAVVSGNPATIVSYVDTGDDETPSEILTTAVLLADISNTRVRGVTLHRLTHARDLRGSLTAAEFAALPFAPRRFFTVYDVPSESVRGAHAHRECSQFLVCLAGSVSCLVDDGTTRDKVHLENRAIGLHIPPMIWGTQWRYTRDALMLVLASNPYDPDDYIRDYEEFLEELRKLGR